MKWGICFRRVVIANQDRFLKMYLFTTQCLHCWGSHCTQNTWCWLPAFFAGWAPWTSGMIRPAPLGCYGWTSILCSLFCLASTRCFALCSIWCSALYSILCSAWKYILCFGLCSALGFAVCSGLYSDLRSTLFVYHPTHNRAAMPPLHSICIRFRPWTRFCWL